MTRRPSLTSLCAAFVLAMGISPSWANFTITQGSGTTVVAIDAANQGTSNCATALTECPATILIDKTGTLFATSSNPLYAILNAGSSNIGSITNITGTVSLPTNAATATLQSTINTTLGSPMQNSGGSVTANAGTNLNTSLLATDAHLTTLGTSALGTDAHLTAFTSANHTDLTTLNTTLGSPMQASGGTVTVTQAAGANLKSQVNIASAGVASGAIASGAVASGAYASGAFAAGSGSDGWNVTEGTKADTAWVSGSGSVIALLKTIAGAGASSSITGWAGSTIGTGTIQAFGATEATIGTGIVPAINAHVTNTNTNGAASAANSSPVTLPADQVAITVSAGNASITAVDAATTTATWNLQTAITGTPTAASFATYALAPGTESVGVQVSGTHSLTLQTELSMDGGTTYFAVPVFADGIVGGHSTFSGAGVTGNFAGYVNTARATHFRVRATAFTSGTATVAVNTSVYPTMASALPPLPANQSTNLAQVNGVTTLTGAGAVGAGSPRIAVGQDTTTIAGSAPGTAGTPSANVLSMQGVAGMTSVQTSPTTAANTVSNPFFNELTTGTTAIGQADNAAWTAGTTPQLPLGCEYTSGGATALTTGHIGAPGCTSARAIFTDGSSIAGTATVTAAAGVQMVGIEGHAAGVFDKVAGAGAAANSLQIEGVAAGTPVITSPTSYPATAVPITASATGTTAATTATLTNVSGHTTYICGYSVRANATAATTVLDTVTGVITATMSHYLWVAPTASGIGIDEQIFSPCVPASAVSTSIAVVSGAPGTGGLVSVTAWGYSI